MDIASSFLHDYYLLPVTLGVHARKVITVLCVCVCVCVCVRICWLQAEFPAIDLELL